MIEEIKPQVKMPLNQFENRELKAYFFIGKSENIWANREGIHTIFSYDLDQAIKKANETAPAGFFIKHIAAVPVRELFKLIDVEGSAFIKETKVDEALAPLPPVIEKKTTREQFIYNLKLATDEFVENKEDKIKLEEIINKINNGN